MRASLMRMMNPRNGTDIIYIPSWLLTSITRYSQEEIMMHEHVMKMVPAFKDVVATLSKDPAQLEAFVAYVSMRIYAVIGTH